MSKDLTTSKPIGYFSEWAVLTEEADGEALNLVDDSAFSYRKFCPTFSS